MPRHSSRKQFLASEMSPATKIHPHFRMRTLFWVVTVAKILHKNWSSTAELGGRLCVRNIVSCIAIWSTSSHSLWQSVAYSRPTWYHQRHRRNKGVENMLCHFFAGENGRRYQFLRYKLPSDGRTNADNSMRSHISTVTTLMHPKYDFARDWLWHNSTA